MKVCDWDLPEDFGDMIQLARPFAENDWERELLYDLEDKYDQYGDDMFLSEKQQGAVRRIYNRSLID